MFAGYSGTNEPGQMLEPDATIRSQRFETPLARSLNHDVRCLKSLEQLGANGLASRSSRFRAFCTRWT